MIIESSAPEIDAIDRAILDILRVDGRATVSAIARAVALSPAPVARRIQRLEAEGVIGGYAAIINESRSGSLEAYTEVHLDGHVETARLQDLVRDVPEVREVLTIAGDTDALVHFRVDDLEHLQRVVNAFRRSGVVAGTKTHIVVHRWSPAATDAPSGGRS